MTLKARLYKTLHWHIMLDQNRFTDLVMQKMSLARTAGQAMEKYLMAEDSITGCQNSHLTTLSDLAELLQKEELRRRFDTNN